DYAVAFWYIEIGRAQMIGVMGCTRYGIMAAALWTAEHLEEMVPGNLYILYWEDADGDGQVDLEEVSVFAEVPPP
ncbi:MAG: hypothetical protein DRO06_04615, partial [Thermoproteota archaeon]